MPELYILKDRLLSSDRLLWLKRSSALTPKDLFSKGSSALDYTPVLERFSDLQIVLNPFLERFRSSGLDPIDGFVPNRFQNCSRTVVQTVWIRFWVKGF